jgi:hypothetical protein
MVNGRCRTRGGRSLSAPKGNRNALKHGRYTTEALAGRREVAALIRTMRALADTAGRGISIRNGLHPFGPEMAGAGPPIAIRR